jgi:iron complex outermembrane receptor protein
MSPKAVTRLDLSVLLALAAMLVPPEPLRAQVTNEQDSEEELEEIVVSGRRNRNSALALFGDVSTREIPLGINIVGADLILRDNAKMLAEILRTDPAYTPATGSTGLSGGVTYGFLRGFLISRYITNGMPQNFNWNIVPAEVTERVEILRGPSAFSYGYMSPGGAINVVSKSPPEKLLGTLFASVDEYGAVGGQLDIGDRIGDDGNFGYRVNLAKTTGDTYLSNSDQDRDVFGVAVDYRFSDRTVLTLNVERVDAIARGDMEGNRRIYDYQGDLLEGLDWKKGVSPPYHFWDVESTTAGLQLDTSITDNIDLTARVAYSDYVDSFLAMYEWNLYPDGYGRIEQVSGGYSIADLNFTAFLNGRFGTGRISHNLSFAVTATDTEDTLKWASVVRVASWFDAGFYLPSDYDPGDLPYSIYTLEEYGVMLSDVVEIDENWRFLLGARWSSQAANDIHPAEPDYVFPEEKNEEVTPLVGVMYNLTPNLGLYANYATGLERGGRAPPEASNAYEQMPARVSKQLEAGLKWQVNTGGATVDFAVFQITQPGEFLQEQEPDPPLYVQDGEQRNRGAEVVLQGRVSDSLSLAGGVQYLDSEIRETDISDAIGSQPIGVPEWQGTLSAEWILQSVPGLSLVAVVSGASVRQLAVPNNHQTGPGYGTGDLGVIYRFELAGKTATAQVRIENVMDREYAAGAGHLFSAPRTAWATFHYELW